jgi:trehalose 6-phosphate synthase/phosphatase
LLSLPGSAGSSVACILRDTSFFQRQAAACHKSVHLMKSVAIMDKQVTGTPGQIIIVSNRLPFSLKKGKRGIRLTPSSGGLVSAIHSMPRTKNVLWIGAANFRKEIWDQFCEKKQPLEFQLVPIFIDRKTEDLYYNEFSNCLIWPLFHYFPSYAKYSEEAFQAYRTVNRKFAEVVASQSSEQDFIWVHDYHLMLVPGYLQKLGRICHNFFLHIPFPSYELVKFIPEDWRNEILLSLLSCAVVGFQTNEYSSHFKRSLSFFLGSECANDSVSLNGHTTLIRDYPISVDFNRFNSMHKHPPVVKLRQSIRNKYKDQKIIFSIDRLDYTKGVINRLEAYELLLSTNPDIRGKVVFIIGVIPSREKIAQYAERRRMIEEYISRVNGLYGSIEWQPVVYQYQHLSFHELLACYTACDIALVTPLRDGMNLVAKEFVASRNDRRGCLILSEFAGAAMELTEAILVNPNDTQLMQKAMLHAISISEEDQETRMQRMREAVKLNDVARWSQSILSEEKSQSNVKEEKASKMSYYDRLHIFEAYRSARRRLIALDYDGTLVPFFNKPQEAVPGDIIREILKKLSSDGNNRLMLISGRDAETLQSWFRNIRMDIVAEHGILFLHSGDEAWQAPAAPALNWKTPVKELIGKYVQKIPGSFVEEKNYSIAWHYRAVENMEEEPVKLALSRELMLLNIDGQFEILHGNKVIEVKSTLMNKGSFLSGLLKKESFDFVLVIGDDATDEDMFSVLREKHHFTIKVGSGNTRARYNVTGVNHVLTFLEQLSGEREPVI